MHHLPSSCFWPVWTAVPTPGSTWLSVALCAATRGALSHPTPSTHWRGPTRPLSSPIHAAPGAPRTSRPNKWSPCQWWTKLHKNHILSICFYLFVTVQKSLIYYVFCDEFESVFIPMNYLNVGLQWNKTKKEIADGCYLQVFTIISRNKMFDWNLLGRKLPI